MDKIKFGTDGWRAIIAKDFTIENVSKIAYATAQWLTKKYKAPTAVIGYDCRFGGEMFLEAVAKILASKNIKVYIPERFVSTPMVSFGVQKLKTNCGIIITASHNPADYNGYKLRGDYGGPMLEKDIKDIEYLINESYEIDLDLLNWNYLVEQGLIQYIDLEAVYIKQIRDLFEINRFTEEAKRFVFDAMYGSAQNVFRRLIPEVKLLHCEVNPTFKGIPPEPVQKNLHELAQFVCSDDETDCGLAVDGDGDRIAMYDEKGNFLDANHILLLLIHYLAGYKKQIGKVVVAYSSTAKVEVLCKKYGLEVERVKIGFKEITKIMISEDVLAGGEESGGIAVGSHIPERDGVWAGLMIWQWMIETGKKLSELVDEVYGLTGKFAFERMDIELNKNIRNKVLEKCSDGGFKAFGPYQVQWVESLDGFKFFFSDDRWLLIRPSGTEPVLRLYAETESEELTRHILISATDLINEM